MIKIIYTVTLHFYDNMIITWRRGQQLIIQYKILLIYHTPDHRGVFSCTVFCTWACWIWRPSVSRRSSWVTGTGKTNIRPVSRPRSDRARSSADVSWLRPKSSVWVSRGSPTMVPTTGWPSSASEPPASAGCVQCRPSWTAGPRRLCSLCWSTLSRVPVKRHTLESVHIPGVNT